MCFHNFKFKNCPFCIQYICQYHMTMICSAMCFFNYSIGLQRPGREDPATHWQVTWPWPPRFVASKKTSISVPCGMVMERQRFRFLVMKFTGRFFGNQVQRHRSCLAARFQNIPFSAVIEVPWTREIQVSQFHGSQPTESIAVFDCRAHLGIG